MIKYYTPEIEEFNHGFEYEVDFENDNTTSPGWNKAIYQLNGSWLNNEEDLEDELNRGRFRVKYLDREDIESLGFKNKENFTPNSLYYKNYRIFMYDINRWNDDYPLARVFKYHDDTDGSLLQKGEEIFRGIIKNKSELKKLLKQLGIDE